MDANDECKQCRREEEEPSEWEQVERFSKCTVGAHTRANKGIGTETDHAEKERDKGNEMGLGIETLYNRMEGGEEVSRQLCGVGV